MSRTSLTLQHGGQDSQQEWRLLGIVMEEGNDFISIVDEKTGIAIECFGYGTLVCLDEGFCLGNQVGILV